jgi:hypothetical protein
LFSRYQSFRSGGVIPLRSSLPRSTARGSRIADLVCFDCPHHGLRPHLPRKGGGGKVERLLIEQNRYNFYWLLDYGYCAREAMGAGRRLGLISRRQGASRCAWA